MCSPLLAPPFCGHRRLIPTPLLERMGLLEQPPHCQVGRLGGAGQRGIAMRETDAIAAGHCSRGFPTGWALMPASFFCRFTLLAVQVSVSAAEGERLLAVTVDDVRRIQLPWGAASSSLMVPTLQPGLAGSGESSAPAWPLASSAAAAGQQQQQGEDEAAQAPVEVDITASLQLENAKLRAELASQIALDCIRSAQLATGGYALVATPPQHPAPSPAAPAEQPCGDAQVAVPSGAPAAAAALTVAARRS